MTQFIFIDDLQISKNNALRKWALFDLGFRPLFLLGSVFALLAIIPWVLSLHGVAFNPTGGGLWWHAHEMIFGFALAIVFGFLLTAGQNWTGVPSASGGELVVLIGLWLLPRLLLSFDVLPWWLAMLLDVGAGLAVAAVLARMLIKVKQWRNVPLVGVLLMLTVLNGTSYVAMAYGRVDIALRIHHGALLWVAVVMNIMGGRVIAFFTERGAGVPRTIEPKWLSGASSAGLIVFSMALMCFGLEPIAMRLLAGVVAVLVGYRWSHWGWRASFKNPLLWSLHVSFVCLPASLALMALGVSISPALHLFTIGAMSGLILSMMSRVSLGHTGRTLQVLPAMRWAYGLMITSALVRMSAGWVPTLYLHLIDGALLLWLLSWGIFLWRYALILLRPRLDGRRG